MIYLLRVFTSAVASTSLTTIDLITATYNSAYNLPEYKKHYSWGSYLTTPPAWNANAVSDYQDEWEIYILESGTTLTVSRTDFPIKIKAHHNTRFEVRDIDSDKPNTIWFSVLWGIFERIWGFFMDQSILHMLELAIEVE